MSLLTEEKGAKQAPSEIAASYPPGGVPRTPMEFRQGPHPKKDQLTWKTPPSRQLSQQKRQEFELDVTERFYDDYIGPRSTGHARNEVLTGVHKLGFNPELYRMNALQGLAYDPSRPVSKNVNYHEMIRAENTREQERVRTQMRQRRLSDTMLLQKPHVEYGQYVPRVTHLEPINFPQVSSMGTQYQQSHMNSSVEEGLNPEIVPGVNLWLNKASQKDRDIATKFIRTISSQGQRPDPATKASTHSSRVRSAVMTPSRQQRQEKETSEIYKQLERSSKTLPHPVYTGVPKRTEGARRKIKRSNSDVSTRGSVFTGTKQQPSHFTIHPEWASEFEGQRKY